MQYWFDALQLECWPSLFFGGDARLISPLVYFIFHHVNRVLELPIRMKEVLANTGWAQIQEQLEKSDEGGLDEKLYKEEAEASAVSNQNKWTDMTMELTAHQNFELLQSRVREARKHRDATVRHRQAQNEEERRRHDEMRRFAKEQREREQRQCEREQCEREKESKKHRETDLERDRRHRWSDKEHRNQVQVAKTKAEKLPPRIPPDEKTLTVKMSQTTDLTEPLPLRCTAPSADGSSSSEQPTQSSSAPASSDAQTPSPTKTPMNLKSSMNLMMWIRSRRCESIMSPTSMCHRL